MSFFTPMLGLILSVVTFVGSASSQQGPGRILITDVTIISPENLDHIAEGNVLIENGRIVSVERGKTTKRLAHAAVVSGKG
jgi:imidazolonepropionase-like amidohydrolase